MRTTEPIEQSPRHLAYQSSLPMPDGFLLYPDGHCSFPMMSRPQGPSHKLASFLADFAIEG
jgi:hypothetical protein